MAGALKTLFGALQASTYLSGVTLAFGEEMISAQEATLPYVVMVPKGGPITADGYEGNGDPIVERRWKINERIEFYLWAVAASSPNADRIDHADAVETLRQQLLTALQDQRAQYADVISVANGNYFDATEQRWQLEGEANTRYGRALILSVNFEITVDTTISTGPIATINTFNLTSTITQGPS